MIATLIDIISGGDMEQFAKSIQTTPGSIQKVLDGSKPKYWLYKRLMDYHNVNPLYIAGHSKNIFLTFKS